MPNYLNLKPGKGRGYLLALAALDHESDECLIWPMSLSCGYGHFGVDKQILLAHTFVCTYTNGSRPSPKYDAAHSCGVRACYNKRHIRWDTRKGNFADKVAHGTQWRGESSPMVKLTEAQARFVKSSLSYPTPLGRALGVSPNTIADIQKGRTWKHL